MSENKFNLLTRINTKDGSSTLRIEGLDETYHSHHGAVQESLYVFIERGFKLIDSKELSILEVGFGTGLNALLSCVFGSQEGKRVFYHSIEPRILNPELIYSLNYPQHISKVIQGTSVVELQDMEKKIQESDWGKKSIITESFTILKTENLLLGTDLFQYDLIYYDAFGPRAQAEMWEIENFKKITPHLKKGGVLTTYCSQGAFRRNLESCGFLVEKLSGPPGKREMVNAYLK